MSQHHLSLPSIISSSQSKHHYLSPQYNLFSTMSLHLYLPPQYNLFSTISCSISPSPVLYHLHYVPASLSSSPELSLLHHFPAYLLSLSLPTALSPWIDNYIHQSLPPPPTILIPNITPVSPLIFHSPQRTPSFTSSLYFPSISFLT